jgi:hypothetical protein
MLTAWNSAQVEQVDLEEYKDLFIADVEQDGQDLDTNTDEIN